MTRTAILVDGGFYTRRAAKYWGHLSPEATAKQLAAYCHAHLKDRRRQETHDLYRIFYYDCLPSKKKIFHPLLGRTIDFGKTDAYTWMIQFLDELKKTKKVCFAFRNSVR